MDYLNTIKENYPFLNFEIFGNTVAEIIFAAIVFGISLLFLKIFKTIIAVKLKKLLEKTKTQIDDMIIGAIEGIHWPFYVFVSIYAALKFLDVNEVIAEAVDYVFMIAIVYYAIRFVSRLVSFGADAVIEKKQAEGQGTGIISLIATVIKIILWLGAIILVLSNLGYNVTSLIAGLGIGGIAIGLAVQNILGDLFASLAIYFDKPFKTGDFVIVGEQMGTIKHVGIKTTRIDALQGEEIVIANSDLTNSRIQNFGVMQRRRIAFNVGVAYDTPAEKLEKIPEWIKEIINRQKLAEVDRSNFKSFGDSSLVYENVYYIMSGSYYEYMDTQQAINLEIVKKFAAEGVEIAFPTQTVYVKKEV